jgi:hypothetical protein
MPLAIFGIDNDGLNLAVNLLIHFIVEVWLALVAWTYLDAKRRLEDPVLIGCATVASLFPFLGTVVYTILRPPEFLEDKRERELEIRTAALRLRQLEESSCPNCEHPVERTYLRCPSCRARIKDPCESCGKPVDPRWSICPYCETPTRRAQERQEKRRSAAPPERQSAPRSSSGSRPTRAKRPASASAAQDERPKRKPAARRTQSSQTSRPKRSGGDEGRTAPAS